MKNSIFGYLLGLLIIPISCTGQKPNLNHPDFNDYWYQGLAELNSYELLQARYGEVHPGEAVLIFVTEDISKSKQVKLDNPSTVPKDAVSVLKMNMTKKFFTGIYPYSIMMSSFKPVNSQKNPNTLKVSTSSQEWCGHTYFQLNENKKGFAAQLNSYFEKEGDRNFQINGHSILEDELWQIIRMNPENLPIGKISIIPSTIHARLRHTTFESQAAEASLTASKIDDSLMTYHLDYISYDRSLSIHYKKDFPYQIMGWTESSVSGFGNKAQKLTTTAKLKKSIMLDYWNKHDLKDASFKDALNLKMN